MAVLCKEVPVTPIKWLIASLAAGFLAACGGSGGASGGDALDSRWSRTASFPAFTAVRSARLAATGAEGTFAVWADATQGVHAAFHDGATGWSAPVRLSAKGTDVEVVGTGAGMALAAWLEPVAGCLRQSEVWASTYAQPVGWSAPERLDDGTAGVSSSVRLAADGHGLVHAAWSRRTCNGVSNDAVTRRRSAQWGPQEVIATDRDLIDVAASPNGSATALVGRGQHGTYELWRTSQGAGASSVQVAQITPFGLPSIGYITWLPPSPLAMDAQGTAWLLTSLQLSAGPTPGTSVTGHRASEANLVKTALAEYASTPSATDLRLAVDPLAPRAFGTWWIPARNERWASVGGASGWSSAFRLTSAPQDAARMVIAPGLLRGLAAGDSGVWSFPLADDQPGHGEKVANTDGASFENLGLLAPTPDRALALWIQVDADGRRTLWSSRRQP